MPKDERVLVLLMGHATNELNIFSKFILMMRKDQLRRAKGAPMARPLVIPK